MAAREEIPQRAAADLYLAMIAGNEPRSAFYEIRTKRNGVRGMKQLFVPITERDRAVRAIANHGQMGDTYVGVAPRTRESGGLEAIEHVWCLWVDIDDADAVQRLRHFEPLPSIVIRSGSAGHLHAYWPLREAVSPRWAKLANRRLAYNLRGDRNATDGARIMRPPNTFNFKHDPRQPVVCTRLELEVFVMPEVVSGLADDPQDRPRPRPLRPVRPMTAESGVDGLVRTVRQAPVGNRNSALFWAVCRLVDNDRAGGPDLDALRRAALEAGLDELEVDTTIASALSQQAAA